MDLVVRDDPDQQSYVITADGAVAGRSFYTPMGHSLLVTHTEVDDAFAGHGVGSALMKGMLDDIRAKGLGVVPQCPFTKAYITKHPEYADLLHKR